MADSAILQATAQITAAGSAAPVIKSFFDAPTFTVTYVVQDPETRRAAIIDSILDFDPASGRTSFSSADAVIAYVEEKGLAVDWLLETHAHADHLSAAPYLQQKLGGKIAIGAHIVTVQQVFGGLFNAGTDFMRDGSDFDHLFADGDQFTIGNLESDGVACPWPHACMRCLCHWRRGVCRRYDVHARLRHRARRFPRR